MGLAGKLRAIWSDKWLGLVFGMWMQACGGLSYTFSLYSPALKQQLQYSQERLDGLGTAKDIGGNVGIISGLLIDAIPPAAVLLIGAAMHISGYSVLYAASMGFIHPPYWQMCLAIMLGTNGATWFNTAVLVTCIRNFQGDRGVVVGLLKGFIGLSGAIFTQIYTAVYAPNVGPYLLLCSIVPAVTAVASALVIRPIDASSGSAAGPPHASSAKDDVDKSSFQLLYVIGVGLAVYLMTVIVMQDALSLSKSLRFVFMCFMILVLLVPITIPWRVASSRSSHFPLPTTDPLSFVSSASHSATSSSSSSASISTPLSPSSAPLAKSSSSSSLSAASSSLLSRAPKLGGEFTLPQAAATLDYWLLFLAMGIGTGSGLTAINNLGQMAESLGSTSIGAFVALVSVWNFLGRMGAGYISEHYVKRYGTPRPLFMLLVQTGMGCAHLLFAAGVPAFLYLGSALVGLAHGAHWTLMVATASELFGLRNFGALYNTLSISAPIGSYCLSVKLAGFVYDRQVALSQAAAAAQGVTLPTHKCFGPNCFRSTFLIMAGLCGVGVLALYRLLSRTRKLYQDMTKVQA